jgi:hypothetical protein
MMRRARVWTSAAAVLLLAAACERAKAPAPASSAASSPASSGPAGSTRRAVTKPWDDELGPMLATPSLDGGAPVVFVRDSSATGDLEVELFNHDERTAKGTLRLGPGVRACAWRRSALITLADSHAPPNSWSLALSPGIAIPFGIDGVGELLPKDSAAMVALISRLVSALPDDSASAPFRGLPIVVRDAWRFQLSDSTKIAVAIAMRSVNVESNPRAQAVTLIAEPDPSSTSGQWRTVFFERFAGPEDRIEGVDLLAAFQMRGALPAIALVREGDDGLQLDIVVRSAPGVWAVKWTSATLPCVRN